jgi:3-methyladenine DNA glycosylase AlkD
MGDILASIRRDLKRNSNTKTQQTGRGFFKEKIKLYGVKSATVDKIGKNYFKSAGDRKKTQIFDLCEDLWRSGYMEESFIACHWSYFIRKQYEPGDLKVFEKWIRDYVGNWASCDTLCNHTVGAFVEMYPEFVSQLKKWAVEKNRWMRRAAAVSLIIPAKKGKFLPDIFDIADALLLDQDDLVQKGYGWMLKAASHTHQKDVFGYIMEKRAVMPRTALRYAIEKMPEELRVKAMEK